MAAPATADLSEDRAWLDAFRRGDAQAFERVFRTYAPYVLSIVCRGYASASGGSVRGILDVETQHDLMQEVFVRVLSPRVRERYDGLRPFPTFLRSIVGNVMLEDARRRIRAHARDAQREPTDADMAAFDAWRPGQALPEEAALAEEDRALLQDYLATLSPEEKRFITVRFDEGQSQRDAADALGLGRQSVRSMEKRLRDGLRAFAGRWSRSSRGSPNPPG